MTFLIPETFNHYQNNQDSIVSKDNLVLCQADYFEACWCKINSSELITCPYLLRYAQSFSNSSYFCVYHLIRKSIECFDSYYILPKHFLTNVQIYCSIILFIIGLTGNGMSMIILISTKLRHLSIYRNLAILCLLNILYLISVFIRDQNIYQDNFRNHSLDYCRLHVFLTAFLGHLCSWQLVSTSIQRMYALLSLQSHRTTSWIRTGGIFFIGIVVPLFIFDGQILFDYGIFKHKHICQEILIDEIRQLRRASEHPLDNLYLSNDIPVRYLTPWIPNLTKKHDKQGICYIWNISDITVYAIIPFIITLICSLIIIVKVCQRRRSTVNLGGVCHTNRDVRISPQDHLSTVLITTNILYILMTGPLNLCFLIQSIYQCIFLETSPFDKGTFDCLIEYLRLLQNSYHALSFIFYCVIGNKFRSSAKSICRTIYSKLIDFGVADRCTETPFVSCCLDRRRSSSSGQTASTNSRLSDNRLRLTGERRPSQSIQLKIIRRPTYVTFALHQNIELEKRDKV